MIHRYTEISRLIHWESKKTFVVKSWVLLYYSILNCSIRVFTYSIIESFNCFSRTVCNSPKILQRTTVPCCKIYYLTCILTWWPSSGLVVPVSTFLSRFLLILFTPLCLRKLIYGKKCWLFRCQMSGDWLALLLSSIQ